MAVNASYGLMSTFKRKARQGVVKGGWLPCRVGMAEGAVVIILACNMIGISGAAKVVLMTGVALFVRPLERRGMAITASHIHVRAGQAVGRGVVIKRAGFPAAHGMTAHAGGIKLAEGVVRLLYGRELFVMATLALLGRVAIAGLMTLNAINLLMYARQAESGLIMIKARWRPG